MIVGPYLFGLTHDVAGLLSAKTLLLPCFHDEPLARLQAWLGAYTQVGGILYHTPEEQDYAERVLGMNHPRANVIGTWLEHAVQANAGTSERETNRTPPLTTRLALAWRRAALNEPPNLLLTVLKARLMSSIAAAIRGKRTCRCCSNTRSGTTANGRGVSGLPSSDKVK